MKKLSLTQKLSQSSLILSLTVTLMMAQGHAEHVARVRRHAAEVETPLHFLEGFLRGPCMLVRTL